MILSETARALRVQMYRDRIAAKQAAAESGDWAGYSAYFASQGLEVAKAEHNAKITQARQLVRSTREGIAEAKVTGVNIAGAISANSMAIVTLDALRTEKETLFGRVTSAGLSGGET